MTVRKNSHITDDQIVTAYSEKMSAYKVATDLGVTHKYVYSVLARRGVHTVGLLEYRKNAERYPRDVQWKIKCEYEGGKSVHELVSEYGGSIYAVLQALRRMGGKTRPPQGKRPKPIAGDQITKACEMYASGMSQSAIGAVLGYSQGIISRVLKNTDVIIRGRAASNEKHGSWKGGRATTGDGYVLVRPEPKDLIKSRRGGMVLEHRLVMVRYLKRQLRKNETVHHINGNRADNRIENLQLHSNGNHGKGHAMRCLDCGSFNIGHVPIISKAIES
jgi:hypothetical protein